MTIVNASAAPAVPKHELFARWVDAATTACPQAAVDIRIVDASESCELNTRFRGKSAATNVLAFAADFPVEAGIPLLGDLVICADIVRREAAEQGKIEEAHWAHLVVHGCLHLQGYDHQLEDEAERMEAQETAILAGLDYPPPYAAKQPGRHHEQ